MIIPILHFEKQIQVKDLTRFDASKSILVKGSPGAINSVLIKAGADASAIEVFSSLPKSWFLDFAFNEYKFDVDATNSNLYFEVNGTKYDTEVAAGTYNLTDLLSAIKSEIETVVSSFTVSFSVDERNRITITPSVPMKIFPKMKSSGLLQHLGFKEGGQLIGYPIEYALRKVTLTVKTATEESSIDEYVEVYTKEGDALFSEDPDLVGFENDIMKWLPQGRGSFLDLHRKSQKMILDWLDRQGYRDDSGKKFTKFAFVDNSDVRMWSSFLTLKLFFMSINNATDDVFKNKADYYSKHEIESRNRAILALDTNGDGKEDINNSPDNWSGRMYFR